MVRAITFDAFGTLVDEGPDVLIGIAREICKDHRPSLRPDALLAAWGRYLYSGADLEPFRSLSKLTRESLGKTFRDHRIEADPNPYVESLESCWRQAKAYPEVRRVLKVLEGVDRKSTRLNSSHTVISYAVFCLKKKKTKKTSVD